MTQPQGEPMAVKYDEFNGVCVMSVDGPLTGETSAALRRLVEERAVPEQISQFVVDLEKAPYIDSDGLGALLLLKQRSESQRGRVKLAGAAALCQRALEVTRLAHRFECYADLAAALKTMR